MTQHQINQAYRRANKPSYQNLTYAEKKIIKLHEKIYWLDLSIRKTYRYGELDYGPNFRKDIRFRDDFELIYEWETTKEKHGASISKLEDKYELDRLKVMKKFRQNNTGRGYGCSF